jgi:hypothetical protein
MALIDALVNDTAAAFELDKSSLLILKLLSSNY